MTQRPQPDPVPVEEPPPHPAEPLQIDTPVIDIQDLEHNPGTHTRVSNKGVKIEPTMDRTDQQDVGMGDEAVLQALEELEQQFEKRLPG